MTMDDRLMRERRLRILHLTAGSDAGGLSRYIFDVGSAMQARGHQIAVAGERGAWHRLFEGAPFPWIDVPLKGGPLALRRAVATLRDWIAANPVDIIHSHYRRPTLVARRLQRTVPVPILYTLHLSDLSLAWPWRMFSDFGDHTHVASQEAKRWAVEEARVPADEVTVIHHGIVPQNFPVAGEAEKRMAREALHIPTEVRVAAFVGRFDDPKNEEWMLDLAEKLPALHVIMMGEGPHEQDLRRRANRAQLIGRVHFVAYGAPLPVYQAADVLLLPSIREGFSLVCAEAMSVGIPCLRTRTAGTTELIVENVTGRSVPIEHDAFVSAAMDFLSDEPALRRMGAAAAEHIRQHFTFDRQLEQTLALYAKVATLRVGNAS